MKHINRILALALAVMMLAVPCMAGPSAEQGGGPSIEQGGGPSVSQTGAPSAEQNGVKGNGEIIITTTMDHDDAKIKADLEAAQTLLADTKDLTTIAPEMTAVMKDMKVETPADKLAVRDLFHVAVTGNTLKEFQASKKITITFDDVELEEGQNLMVMVLNGDHWDMVPAADVKVEDGKVTVTFTVLGIVAFVFCLDLRQAN